MARRSLRPQLNQIRAWVRQGRTDAWIAHQLEVSASELREFRRQHDLTADDDENGTGEIDLRDEIEAEIEAATADEAEEDEAEDDEDEGDEEPSADPEAEAEDEDEDEEADTDRGSRGGRSRSDDAGDSSAEGRPRRRRRRGRRGGRGRRKTEIEATFDHGTEEGYGLWLDPAVRDNPAYAEHWAGHRAVTVTVEPDQIVIRRSGDSDGAGSASDDD